METMSFEPIDPSDSAVRTALARYHAEMSTRVAPSAISPREIEDVDDYVRPGGVFLVGLVDGEVAGCGAVRALDPGNGVGEIKRMWIDPSRRGQRNGVALIAALEAAAGTLGYRRLRLDTNDVLIEAVHLYESCGYRRIDRYNPNPDANLFYEKELDDAHQ
jgi:GNAT superfamily N-acetyltransferase